MGTTRKTCLEVACDHCRKPTDTDGFAVAHYANIDTAVVSAEALDWWVSPDKTQFVCEDDILRNHAFVPDRDGGEGCDRCQIPADEHGEPTELDARDPDLIRSTYTPEA